MQQQNPKKNEYIKKFVIKKKEKTWSKSFGCAGLTQFNCENFCQNSTLAHNQKEALKMLATLNAA